MATLAALGRMSGRLNRRRLAGAVVTPRGFRTSAAALAAQNFTMPALSPTMTEGNIATWRIKEGDKFSAGDVLLEIETDKATMDVEAQDEGILMKIMQGDGAKAVKVGARIAVLAEEGDDISALEIPPDESAAEETPQKQQQPKSSEASSQPPQPSDAAAPAQPAAEATKRAPPGGKPSRVIYPLLPSVAQLVREKGIDESAVAQIVATGPNGRLLKGDILAHLGVINQQTPATISERFEKLSHLDLSNIKLAKPAPKPQSTAAAAEASAPTRPTLVEVSLPVSFDAAMKLNEKLRGGLGFDLPLPEYIGRASDLANDDLPVPSDYQPTADELFDQVLGLTSSNAPITSRGNYRPRLAGAMEHRTPKPSVRRRPDIIDVLAGPSGAARRPALQSSSFPGFSYPTLEPSGPRFVSLTVPKTEEKRAKTFLERFKVVMEDEIESLAYFED
ncbi:pyruvate dehydrogenase complex protein X component [Gaeumannomyces tritici R3-111a-1]|uniref:Pyruvate dehydrogenase complex protein X component n=1 Tax=Gaeumannomyces tritici (strain R3-111a-1) TaxID=644352 RepID=J3NKC0_GAET3|nr:pyruvate dehydrogenase complex protein X component [Gaeumannomyces tritici R3-111a-1]EJT81724.1 pyruvate dehydrogenase complex protein X component [Gaeumannomyces tritici R3-111a-1]